ncbi:MAG: hypothetical protein IPG50_17270 [Myxococcales bacterium]|nr:hypothetical protein [Myxococcales bacterium]
MPIALLMRSAPKARPLARMFSCAFALAGLTSCVDKDENQVLSPVVVGMTANTPSIYSDGQLTLFQVQTPVRLPMRRAEDGERTALGQAPPLPRMPLTVASDVEITVRFTLVNLDDVPRTVQLLLDPWNEFVRYRPLVQVVSEDETTPDFSGFDKYFILAPKERLEGVITPDDTKEMAIDLATAQVLIAKPPSTAAGAVNGLVNRAMNLQNRSSGFDPLLSPIIATLPAVPALVGFDLSLRTTEKATVAVEVIVDLRDLKGDRILPPGDERRAVGVPGTILSPPPPARQ